MLAKRVSVTADSPNETEYKISNQIFNLSLFFVLCRSDNPEGLDVYMHILQLLTTVDEGIQAIGKTLELLIEWDQEWQ